MNPMYELLFFGCIAGYLLGSIPFGLLIGLAKGVDIRKVGSGNIGATNLGRTFGYRYFWYAFLLDAFKGFLPTLVVSLVAAVWKEPSWLALVTGVAALCGHMFPIFLKFKGGKGVATTFGVVLGIWPIFTLAGIAGGVVFVLVFMAFRYISLASMVGATCFSVFAAILGLYEGSPFHQNWDEFRFWLLAAVLFAALIIAKHRANIRRLMAGTEPKYTQKK